MEPLTLATAFATLVSLLGQFLGESDKRKQATIEEFLEWLRRKNHQQLVDLINENQELSRSIAALVGEKHDVVMAKLDSLDKTLSRIASGTSDFKAAATAIHPDSILSAQALSILRQTISAGASRFIELTTRGGTRYVFMDGSRGELEVTEQTFIEDDLAILCDAVLLRPEMTDSGGRIFHITRAGATIAGAPTQTEADKFLEYKDGLNGDELYRLAKAVINQTQTIEAGQRDDPAATLTAKGFLKRVETELFSKGQPVPHIIPPRPWQFLNSNKSWLIGQAIHKNQDRNDRIPFLSEGAERISESE